MYELCFKQKIPMVEIVRAKAMELQINQNKDRAVGINHLENNVRTKKNNVRTKKRKVENYEYTSNTRRRV
ncbi:hypothetical protein FACS1894132_03440 [Clostridia bacterium]|nr:hypothetical protein FACS1894132_03440 [Clostridia bacterium]